MIVDRRVAGLRQCRVASRCAGRQDVAHLVVVGSGQGRADARVDDERVGTQALAEALVQARLVGAGRVAARRQQHARSQQMMRIDAEVGVLERGNAADQGADANDQRA